MYAKWRSEIPQMLIVVGMLAAAVAIWPNAPKSFPVHWNIHGEVDRYGSKFEGVFLLPLLSIAIYALLVLIPRIDPGRANYPSFRRAFLVIRLSILIFLAVIYACTQLVAFGYAIEIGMVVPLAMGVLFIVLGNVMGKIRPNWFVGVRTPWTLSSRRSWNKTHRLAGWMFIVMGLAIGACGFSRTAWMLAIAGTVTVISMIWIILYSYLVWRDDPEKLSPSAIVPFEEENELS